MRFSTALVVAGFIAMLAVAASASDVVDVKDSTFEDVINSHELVLMEFYAPWCGHCKKLAPEWDAAAAQLKGQAVVAKIDATAEPQNAAKYEVRGYPTIKVFRDGKLAGDYEGQRSADAIVKYVKGNSGPAVTDIAGQDDLEKLKSENAVLVVLFGAEPESETLKVFTEVSKKLRSNYKFASSTNALSEKAGTIVVFKGFDEPREEYTGEITEEALSNFINSAGIRLFDEIGPENYKMYMERGLPMGWLFVTPDAEETDSVKAAAAKVAKSFKGKISFIWIDAAKYGGMAQRLGLKGDKFPAFALDHSGSHFVFDESKEITEADLEAFTQSYLSGSLSQTVRSEKEPAEHTVEGLTTVVGTTFDSLVLKAETDVLIEFYAPWCGHCKQLAPTYAKVAKAVNGRVRIAQIDATANDFPQSKFNVQGFPTIYYVKQGGEAKQFEGDRSFDGFAKFLQDNSGVSISE